MKKTFLKITVIFLTMILCITCGMSVSARQMWMHVNNNGVQREVCQVWGFDMLPVLDIAGELGYQVAFDGHEAVIYNDYNAYGFKEGDASVYDYYGNWYGLDVVPQYIKGRFMIPAKFFTDVLGCSYVWDPAMDYLFLNSDYMYNVMINSPEYTMAKKYHTNWLKQKARADLRIPSYVDVDCILGAPYYWDGAGIYLTPVRFYRNGELVACADFQTDTYEMCRGIYSKW